MSLSTIDLIVVIAYAIGIFSLAQWVSREKAGHEKDTSDYFLASKNLPWWAIGSSLIAANISAEQIVGMSGSGYAIGLAIASYEWMAAATLLIVGKFFLPIFLQEPHLHDAAVPRAAIRQVLPIIMAIFWLALYVFVNLTSIIWLGSIAVNKVAGINQTIALIILGAFALALPDPRRPQGGGADRYRPGDAAGPWRPGRRLSDARPRSAAATCPQAGTGSSRPSPDHFHMILKKGDPHYIDLPGLSVLIGGMWIANISLLGLQPVHHPARARGEEPRRGADAASSSPHS